MINIVAKLISILNSETEPGQISLAFCLSMVIGFTPVFCPHNLLVLLLVLFLRANLSAFLFGWAVFSAIAYLLDPLFHAIGYKALTAQPLHGLWTSCYNMTLWRLENFNNSIVMGSLIVSLTLFIPLYFIFNVLIKKYRGQLLEWVRKTKVMGMLKASKLYIAYKALAG